MLKQILLVGLGGGIGTILRFLTSVLTSKYYSGIFPFPTFLVNIIGCFLIGLLIGVLGHDIQSNQNLKLLFIIGFGGGYTTFSAFAAENISLINSNNYLTLVLYIGLSVLVGLLAVWLGLALSR